MERLHEPAIERCHALALSLGFLHRGDRPLSLSELLLVRGEEAVHEVDLRGMDDGLSGHAVLPRLNGLLAEALVIGHVVDDAVDDVDLMGCTGQHQLLQSPFAADRARRQR